MAVTVTMPQLGESVNEGTIGKWLKQPGDPVARYESIAEVISDKVNAEIPAPQDGVMGEHIAPEGAVVMVGEPICYVETSDAAVDQGSNGTLPVTIAEPTPVQEAPPVAQPAAAAPSAQPATAPAGQAAPPAGAQRSGGETGAAGSLGTDQHMTPAVRMLIREHGVDPAGLRGTGIAGRITKKDVLEFVQRRDAGEAQPAAAAARAGQPQSAPPAAGVLASGPMPAAVTRPASAEPGAMIAGEHDTLVPLNPIRKLIAEHMVRSKATSPHAWLMVEVDMTGVVALRTRRKGEYRQRYNVNLTFLPIIARVVCDVLRQFPNFNATWSEDGVVQRGDVNLGIAVALEDNLVVPVIRNADRLSVSGLAQSFDDVAQRARANRLRVEDLQGGTFTLNNTGALGLVATAAIINQPQAAIVTTDAIVKRAVVLPGDLIGIRSMMNLCMSLDHRINDGLQGARFLNAVKTRLEETSADTAM